jgi:hypothetical protein
MLYCCLLTLSFLSIVAAHLNTPIFPACTKASQASDTAGRKTGSDASRGVKSLGVSPSSGVKVLNLAVVETKPPPPQNR